MTIEIDRYDYDADQRVLDQENEAKNAPKRSHTKKTSDQTGLLWTFSALALAACGGGGGGGGGPVVTGPANTPSGANIPDSNQGNLSSLSGAPIGRISSDGAFSTDTNSDENGEFSLASPVIADALAQDGFLAARVGGLVDTAHGRQIKDGGVDAKGNYVGPVWLTMPGETIISPLTNRIAEAYREEISRLAEGETLDINQFYDVQLRSIFGEDARYITQADLFNADNYKILNLDEFTLIEDVRAKASSFEGTDTVELNIRDIISRQALREYLKEENPSRYDNGDPNDNLGKDLQALYDYAHAIERGEPYAVPQTDITTPENTDLTLTADHFGFQSTNPDAALTHLRITSLPGRHEVALRPEISGDRKLSNDVTDLPSATPDEITYDDHGVLILKDDDGNETLIELDNSNSFIVTLADILAGNLIFRPGANFDRTASFTFQLYDGLGQDITTYEAFANTNPDEIGGWNQIRTIFITVEGIENAPVFYSDATPADQQSYADSSNQSGITTQYIELAPVETTIQDPENFAYQALADDPDTKDGFGDVTYSLKQDDNDDASLFEIEAQTGHVTFIQAPNFENPHDLTVTNGRPDGIYEFTVIATSNGLSTEQAVTLHVQDRNEGPQQLPVGNGHYLSLADDAYIDVNTQGIGNYDQRSVESWVRVPNASSDSVNVVLFSWGSSDEVAGDSWFIVEINEDGKLQLNTNHGVRELFTGDHADITDNKWHHVAVTYRGEGDDTIMGGEGADILNGGADSDTITGGAGNDTITGGDNDDTIDGGEGNDTIMGGEGADILNGGADSDAITGGAGGDTIDGGAGSDIASYAGSDAAVSIDLSMNTASGGHAEGDILTNIENLIGSDHDDTLKGDFGSNVIDGGAGADTLRGNGGNDVFVLAGGDTVEDFADGIDMLDVGDVTHVHVERNGNNFLLLDANANNAVIATLEGVSSSSVITADDFMTDFDDFTVTTSVEVI